MPADVREEASEMKSGHLHTHMSGHFIFDSYPTLPFGGVLTTDPVSYICTYCVYSMVF
jgi:hypothetical protein